jgi:hypothetical protein
MLSHYLIDATGLVALSLDVGALLRPGDRTLLKIGSWASALWAINSLLIGAPTAAALSALSVWRQASAVALQNRPGRLKCAAFNLFVGATLGGLGAHVAGCVQRLSGGWLTGRDVRHVFPARQPTAARPWCW